MDFIEQIILYFNQKDSGHLQQVMVVAAKFHHTKDDWLSFNTLGCD